MVFIAPPHILVVDDDARLRGLLREYLGDQGWLVTTACDAADARRKLTMFVFDLMVLDVMMPGESGIELADSWRRQDSTPILMLTAMGETEDRIRGLEAGADDYLSKPFEPRELVLRIENILQRTRAGALPAGPVHFGEYVFDSAQQALQKNGEPVHLTTGEVALLGALAVSPGTALSREELAAALPGEGGSERGVDVQVTRLRKKIEPEPGKPVYLQTVRGAGYVLRVG